jgi:hypothetical protein
MMEDNQVEVSKPLTSCSLAWWPSRLFQISATAKNSHQEGQLLRFRLSAFSSVDSGFLVSRQSSSEIQTWVVKAEKVSIISINSASLGPAANFQLLNYRRQGEASQGS